MASLPRELRYERGGRSCGIGEIGHDASLRTIDAEWPISWRAAAKRVRDTIEPKLDREINEKASATGFATDLFTAPAELSQKMRAARREWLILAGLSQGRAHKHAVHQSPEGDGADYGTNPRDWLIQP
jgi:hypothetical protein